MCRSILSAWKLPTKADVLDGFKVKNVSDPTETYGFERSWLLWGWEGSQSKWILSCDLYGKLWKNARGLMVLAHI